MGPSSDQLEHEIGELRDSLESRIVELRERSRKQVRRASRAALVALAVGAAVGVTAVGVFVAYRLLRPPTTRERLQRVIPAGLLKDARRLRQSAELLLRRELPPVRLYVGDRQVGEQRRPPRWEAIALRGARVAGSAAAGVAMNRLVAAVRPGGGKAA